MRNTVREVHQAVRDGVIEDPIAEILSWRASCKAQVQEEHLHQQTGPNLLKDGALEIYWSKGRKDFSYRIFDRMHDATMHSQHQRQDWRSIFERSKSIIRWKTTTLIHNTPNQPLTQSFVFPTGVSRRYEHFDTWWFPNDFFLSRIGSFQRRDADAFTFAYDIFFVK
jgi:hypothetical protein